jgi:hypothetical protein
LRDAVPSGVNNGRLNMIVAAQLQILNDLTLDLSATKVIKADDVFHYKRTRLNGLDYAHVLPVKAVTWVFDDSVMVTDLRKSLAGRTPDNNVDLLPSGMFD